MIIGSDEEKTLLEEGGKRLAAILTEVAQMVAPGVSTKDLDDAARMQAREVGGSPAFLNYTPSGASRPYPASLCVSINNEVVHGIPNEVPKTLKEGDILTLDMGLVYEGFITDMAVTVGVGEIDVAAQKLITAARDALDEAIAVAQAGKTTGDIGHAVESLARRRGFSTAEELGGHGVGRAVHEQPFVPNVGAPGTGARLEEGMVLAIEPIIMEGKGGVQLARDGYTYTSEDGKRSSQFEHTIIITDEKAKILTRT